MVVEALADTEHTASAGLQRIRTEFNALVRKHFLTAGAGYQPAVIAR